MSAPWLLRAPADDAAASEQPPADPPANTPTEDSTSTPADDDAAPAAETHPPKRPLLQRNQLSVPPPPASPAPTAPSVPAPPIPQSQTNNPNNPDDADPDHPNTTSNNNGGPAPSTSPGQPGQQPQPQAQGGQGPQGPQGPQDSLSLAQLRRIVAEFPRAEPIAYDYVYTDMAPLDEEVDEWFMYNFWQFVRLNAATRAFYSAWGRLFPSFEDFEGDGGGGVGDNAGVSGWDDDADGGGPQRRVMFVKRVLEGVQSGDRIARAEAVGALVYLVLGRWTETVKGAGILGSDVLEGKARSAATGQQLAAMREGVRLVAECGGLEVVWDLLRAGFELFW